MFGFSDLEDKLMGADGQQVLSQTLEDVRAIASDVSAALEGGLPSEDYEMAQALLLAAQAAEHILLTPIPTDGA